MLWPMVVEPVCHNTENHEHVRRGPAIYTYVYLASSGLYVTVYESVMWIPSSRAALLEFNMAQWQGVFKQLRLS